MKYFLFLLLSICLCSCGQNLANNSNLNSNVNIKQSANINSVNTSPDPGPDIIDNTLEAAITEFINKHYKGWKLHGDTECVGYGTCKLHLVKGTQDKVVTVFTEKFRKPDGHEYWLVYEATKLDLTKDFIESERESAVEYAKANLDEDDCAGVIEAVQEAGYDDREDYEPYDPH